MEKTLARAIYKRMEIGREYKTSELCDLIDDVYYSYVPRDMWPFQENGKSWLTVVSGEMWKIVKAGYATTHKKNMSLPIVRGIRFGSKPTCYHDYTIRYWKRIK